jgi:MraZ protein
MFLGTYAPKLDEKGRIILPAKFRDELASGIVLTRGQEHCVYVFSQREFESLHEKIRQAPVTSKQARTTSACSFRERVPSSRTSRTA